MFLIKGILVSREIFAQKFVCNLNVCKGACCWEGDWGAPIDEDEEVILSGIREQVRPFLNEEGNQAIDEQGAFTYYKEPKKTGTTLVSDGRCAYMTIDAEGCAQCGFEQAHRAGVISFKKPLSCHLYPIRHQVEDERAFAALNYDEWDICSAACDLGTSLRIPVYQFVKDAIIRKFGEEFYAELDALAKDLEQ
ncbi:MAG: DUF3109 family protein [Saprospiraceae bacterium]|nr:DUF3109 family protein [Saprospiraceae bacterium]